MEGQQESTITSQNEFCHSGNFDAAVAYLSQELVLVGLPAVVASDGRGPLDTVSLVNAAWQLLRSARDGLTQRQGLQQRLARAEADRQQLEASLSRCREQHSALEARSAQQQEQQRQLTAQLSSGQARLAELKDELRRLQSVLQQRAAHYQHELKKQERQAERLKDMTRRLLDRERRGGGQERHSVVLSGLLGRTDGTRARWRTPAAADRAREEAYERVLAGCEARHLRLVEDTQRLGALLGTLLKALVAASEQVSCEQHCRPCGDPALLTALELGLPSDQIGDRLDGLVSCQLNKLARLTERAGERPAADGACSPRQEEQLRQRLEEAERMVVEQRLVIEATTGGDDCDDSFQRNAFLVEERAELALRERLLEEQRQAVARERDMYTEAVLRLGRERMAFDAERAELTRRQFLASSPLLSRRPASARSPGEAVRVEPPSPARSPAGRSPQLLLTAPAPALSASADRLLVPADATGLRVTSPARRAAGATPRSQRRSPAARSPSQRCLSSPDPYLSELGLPASLYRADPTDRTADRERAEP